MAFVAHRRRARSSPRARARSASAPGVVRRGSRSAGMPTLTSTSTSRMPLRAAASTVASESTATVTRAPHSAIAPQPAVVDRLVREEQVVAEPGARQPDDLARRRGRERRGGRGRPARARAPCTCAPSRAAASARPGSAAVIVSRLRVERAACRPRAQESGARRRGTCARMARAADARRGTTADRPRLVDRGAARRRRSAYFLIPAERWIEAPADAARRSAPTSASTSSRTSGASAGTCCGAPGPRPGRRRALHGDRRRRSRRAVDVPPATPTAGARASPPAAAAHALSHLEGRSP